ncbi:MAG: hypothetical protein CO094_05940 [Anaerolineae bacterium CG_4_9_14_3_um_filter_57_17]|nr:hypothetical protein [bacterium]NCT20774.1 hypothetical protein [bacterium]OIO84112.1 MAG: hypothetical protein AUK01_10735 [Anaerolineae bacterium CG2_30_57_67]PJB66895.1 MAG: hypothetical protein CO094_05940 [Anaerolineae bacterium CG_4_9_14_3_um_filter_57_17]
MKSLTPVQILWLAFALVFTGWLIPIFIVLKFLPSTFLLNFLAYGASMAGVLMGITGVALYNRARRK